VSVFADTSALYALMVRTEPAHAMVRATFEKLLEGRRPILTTSLVMLETMTLLQGRIGLAAARDFDEHLTPIVRVSWVNDSLYRLGVERLWREDRPQLSLVDCISFEFMKAERLTAALAVDANFSEAGFRLLA
jgi:predicted nucleic acid-binding protein